MAEEHWIKRLQISVLLQALRDMATVRQNPQTKMLQSHEVYGFFQRSTTGGIFDYTVICNMLGLDKEAVTRVALKENPDVLRERLRVELVGVTHSHLPGDIPKWRKWNADITRLARTMGVPSPFGDGAVLRNASEDPPGRRAGRTSRTENVRTAPRDDKAAQSKKTRADSVREKSESVLQPGGVPLDRKRMLRRRVDLLLQQQAASGAGPTTTKTTSRQKHAAA